MGCAPVSMQIDEGRLIILSKYWKFWLIRDKYYFIESWDLLRGSGSSGGGEGSGDDGGSMVHNYNRKVYILDQRWRDLQDLHGGGGGIRDDDGDAGRLQK